MNEPLNLASINDDLIQIWAKLVFLNTDKLLEVRLMVVLEQLDFVCSQLDQKNNTAGTLAQSSPRHVPALAGETTND